MALRTEGAHLGASSMHLGRPCTGSAADSVGAAEVDQLMGGF
jgi:hypothetical protein